MGSPLRDRGGEPSPPGAGMAGGSGARAAQAIIERRLERVTPSQRADFWKAVRLSYGYPPRPALDETVATSL